MAMLSLSLALSSTPFAAPWPTRPPTVRGVPPLPTAALPHKKIMMAAGADPSGEREHELSTSRAAFVAWAARHAVPIECLAPARSDGGGVACPQGDQFLSSLGDAIEQSAAAVVLLSEGYHNCREMMTLHHRIVQHLVVNCGFGVVGSESGLPESRDVAEYIASPERGYTEIEKQEMWRRGLTKMYSAWEEGRELIEWMREYNCQQPTPTNEDARDMIVVGYCGLDIGGFYTDWSYPISNIQRYLRDQLPEFEVEWSQKIKPILDLMGNTKARHNYQHLLTPEQKSTLALLLDELVSELQSRGEELAGEAEFEWARQSAIAMKLAENYYRNYENMSLGESISKYTGLDGREIAMAHNMMWRLNLEHSHEEQSNVKGGLEKKMAVINHIIHTKTATQYQDGVWGHFVPMGQLMRQMLASEAKQIFNVGIVYGGGTFWNRWQKPDERFVDTVPTPKDDGLEVTMKWISKEANMVNFFLHWEKAPKEAWLYLNEVTTIRENDYYIKAYPLEWNACIYLDEVSHATPAEIEGKL